MDSGIAECLLRQRDHLVSRILPGVTVAATMRVGCQTAWRHARFDWVHEPHAHVPRRRPRWRPIQQPTLCHTFPCNSCLAFLTITWHSLHCPHRSISPSPHCQYNSPANPPSSPAKLQLSSTGAIFNRSNLQQEQSSTGTLFDRKL
jgi:hypothetical protein